MSWLSNVNNLLTKLDDQVETVAEERALAEDDEGTIDGAKTGIDDILAKRGLSSVGSEDNDSLEVKEEEQQKEVEEREDQPKDKNIERIEIDDEASPHPLLEIISPVAIDKKTAAAIVVNDQIQNAISQNDMKIQEGKIPSMKVDETETQLSKLYSESTILQQESVANNEADVSKIKTTDSERHYLETSKNADKKEEITTSNSEIPSTINPMLRASSSSNHGAQTMSPPPSLSQLSNLTKEMIDKPTAPQLTPALSSLPSSLKQNQRLPAVSPNCSQKEHRELVIERKEAQKEARTLRRHVVSLNEQLEAAESELQAQRKELERAAERMEKDRVRQKEGKDASQKRQVQEITLLKTQHGKSLKEQQKRYEEQLERNRRKLSEEEKRRKQEGGNWDKEMSHAIDREQEMCIAVSKLEEEKLILLQQISTLQGQQTALGLRLESLTQAADNSMEREREAEDRLDVALNQHARQISQRQARESELERTVQELNAALVASRDNDRSSGTCIGRGGNNASSGANPYSEARISALEMDLQNANSQLAMEKEQSQTSQMQFRNFSKETAQEANIVHAKQIQYDRKMADMSLIILKLEAKLREYEKLSPGHTASFNDDEAPNQIKLLSEEVLRLRDKIANQNSESLAMKTRLKVAVDRSNKLEDELIVSRTSANGDGNAYESMERALNPKSGGGRRRHGNPSSSSSIRTAMLLNSSGGDRTEKIGHVVDQIDSFAVSTGKYLRRNPIARAGFIFYLILIHLWTFVILFFHAHSFETIPSGAFGEVPHSPHAIIQEQKIERNIDSATAVTNSMKQKLTP